VPDDTPPPWHAWARQLSLAYGWTPDEIAALTVAQVRTCLAGAAADRRQRMSLADGLALCRRRRAEKRTWIHDMMERTAHGT
jgi:hypothetical protein